MGRSQGAQSINQVVRRDIGKLSETYDVAIRGRDE